MSPASTVLAGAALYTVGGGIVGKYIGPTLQNNFSPALRIERMVENVKEAEEIYKDVHEEVQRLPERERMEVLVRCEDDCRDKLRLKGEVRNLKQQILNAPWHERFLPWYFKESLGEKEGSVGHFLDDAKNTSAWVVGLLSQESSKPMKTIRGVSAAMDNFSKLIAHDPLPTEDTQPKISKFLSTVPGDDS